MEINRDIFLEIQKIIKSTTLNKDKRTNYEIEARLLSSTIDFYKYEKILNGLIFSKYFGGYELEYRMDTTLDINIDNYRATIYGKDDVKMYWLTEEFNDKINHKFMNKENINKVDIDDYNIRISLSKETELDKTQITNFIKLIKDTKKVKNYRLKNRYYIKSTDGLFRFDLTSIKMISAPSFKTSGIFKHSVNYEVELELINKEETDADKIFESMFKNINILLKLYYDTNYIIKKSDRDIILESYKRLVKETDNNKLFILANSQTINRLNLIETHKPNILKDYAVSIKADGLRNLIYIDNIFSKNTDNGEMYIIDNTMNITYTGINIKNWAGTLIECEYIKSLNLLLCYNMLFERGNDIRGLPFIGESKTKTRYGYLELFIKSIEGAAATGLNIKIEIVEQRYIGNIFENIDYMWKKSVQYKVDGLMFTPINEKYPTKCGLWDTFFKWKPAEENSFDFLIKVEKNNNGEDIKQPYVIYGPNNVSKIYQYKTLILYVGSNKNNEYVPIEFDPNGEGDSSGTGDSGTGKAKILLDENGKMIIVDNITGKNIEIIDDTIVEFIYKKGEEVFKWVPIKVRYDKTALYKSGEKVYGNNDKTALNIWKTVIDPISFEQLSCGDVCETDIVYDTDELMKYQIFNNTVINNVLDKEIKKDDSLLNIICDNFLEIDNTKYASVVNIYDKDMKIDEKGDNYIEGDLSKKIFPNYDISEKNKELLSKYKEIIPSKYMFNAITIQNCLPKFFESDKKFKIFLQNINNLLKIGGYFIGICLDGERVIKELKNSNIIEGIDEDKTLWKIEKAYKGQVFTSNRTQYDKNINIFTLNSGGFHTESLINFTYFDKMLVEYGFEKIKITQLSELYNKNNDVMNDDEKRFSFLHNLFIYKKTENLSDKLQL